MIWAVVLAAGESRRMGQTKLLLPINGKSIIESVLDTVVRSKTDRILVVLGADSQRISKKIEGYDIHSTVNPHFREGMLSSIQWGLKALRGEVSAVLVVLGDQPSISSDVIDALIAAYGKVKKGIVVPAYKGKRGHPVLIDEKYFEEIAKLNPEIGLRELLHRHPEDVLEVEAKTASILGDVDTIKDYWRELKKRS